MYYKDNDMLKTVCVVSAILIVVSVIVAFICIPVKGYMEVESYHWNWTIDVY